MMPRETVKLYLCN